MQEKNYMVEGAFKVQLAASTQLALSIIPLSPRDPIRLFIARKGRRDRPENAPRVSHVRV